MSADDRTEMSEGMAEFWARVKDALPPLLKSQEFVSVSSLGDPDVLEIFTVWWNGCEEHIATLNLPAGRCGGEPRFVLVVDMPGIDGRTVVGVDAEQVAEFIENRAADQVRAHLPGVWSTGPGFEWDGKILATFDDVGSEAKDMGGFTEYVQNQADRALARRALTTMIDLLLREDAPFTMASFPLYGRSHVTLADRTVKIRANYGRATVTVSDTDGEPKGSVEITMGSRGVSYPFCTMEDLIYEATGRNR